MIVAPTTSGGCVDCESGYGPLFCGPSKVAPSRARQPAPAGEYPKGEVVFAKGQPACGVYVLCRGRVKLSVCSGEAVPRS